MAIRIRVSIGGAAYLAAIAMAICGGAAAQQSPDAVRLHVYPVQGAVSVIAGAGGNITVQNGKDGTLLVDTGAPAASAKLMTEVQSRFRGTVLWIINTQGAADHIGGNDVFASLEAAKPVNVLGARLDGSQPLNIIAHSKTVAHLANPGEGDLRLSSAGMPNDVYFTPFKDIRFNDEAVVMYYEPNAITDGDTIVHFRKSDVISAGDIFTPGRYPAIDVARGGSINGLIAAVNHILDLTVPGFPQEGGTVVIPGHGRICDEADVVEFRDMTVIVRDRVQDMIRRKMTLEQVLSAAPSRDYDPEYVTPDSAVKANDFVAAIYRSLKTR